MLPTLFISHGSPMLAIDPGPYGAAWRQLAEALPQPSAILMVSAHWTTPQPILSTAAQPATIHDFGGFPSALYELRYPAPGAPALAIRTQQLLLAAGIPASVNPQRGLDHGAWVPLRQMYPAADIPVAQLSVQPDRNGDWHLRLGTALRALRADNVLVIGSGSLTHNLYEAELDNDSTASSADYVHDFQTWVYQALQQHDNAALAAWTTEAPHARRAHPTPEHFLPLLVAYAAAGDAPRVERILDNYSAGVLAMDCYRFD